jgi:hypothetical protein
MAFGVPVGLAVADVGVPVGLAVADVGVPVEVTLTLALLLGVGMSCVTYCEHPLALKEISARDNATPAISHRERRLPSWYSLVSFNGTERSGTVFWYHG